MALESNADRVPAFFKERRDRLMAAHPGSVFIFPSPRLVLRNNDVHFPFRQESNFFYLTGFEEPDSCLVLVPSAFGSGTYRTVLFVLPRDPEKEMWEGERFGIEGAQNVFGADEAFLIHDLETKLPELFDEAERIYYRLGVDAEVDQKMIAAMEVYRARHGRSGKSLLPVLDPTESLGEMRLFKSVDELRYLRKACEISALAHKTAMKKVRPGMNESEIEAWVDFGFREGGCQRTGYGSIVAGGKNATCLHYRSNNKALQDGDLLLIDAGGEYNYYTADITRTFPVGRAFSKAQAKIYDLVLKAQKEGIAMTRPGVLLTEIHKKICSVLVDGMLSLGFLTGDRDELLKSGAFRQFYPHNTSHWLGIDVHDVGLYRKDRKADGRGDRHSAPEPRPLEAGMVFTIEPGFYVQPSNRQVPEEYRNIGIRIEDDILVTENGCENLTAQAPKEREEIESLRNY